MAMQEKGQFMGNSSKGSVLVVLAVLAVLALVAGFLVGCGEGPTETSAASDTNAASGSEAVLEVAGIDGTKSYTLDEIKDLVQF